MRHRCTPALLLLLAGCAIRRDTVPCTPATAPASTGGPRVDHHQHLLSEDARRVTVEFLRGIGETTYMREAEREPLVDADTLIRMLDEAGIAKALVFSNASYFSRTPAEQPGEYERVKAENDWTLAEVRRYPDRLFAACSVNPRRAYALDEIERCAASGGYKALKLHFDGSGVDLANPAHVAGVRRAFAAANRLRLPIVAHLQSEAGYGGAQARTFLREIMPAAPDIPVTVNHLWGGGRFVAGSAEALAELAAAFRRGDPVTRDLWFDLAQIAMAAPSDTDRAQIAARMREIGMARMLYGSDGPEWSGVPPKQHWDELGPCLLLTSAELDAIAANVAPYLR